MYKAMIQHRIENLARLLKADYKPVELQTLDCIGVITRYLQGGDLSMECCSKFAVEDLQPSPPFSKENASLSMLANGTK